MAKISIRNVSHPGAKHRGYGAVEDVSLEIADHEMVALAGPPGSGTSTLLRMIAGLEEIPRGEIQIGERRVNDIAARDRDTAMVFPTGALYPHMSVLENLAFGLKLRKFAKLETRKRVDEAAAILGIGELLDQHPNVLTAEQRHRVALGRAIVRRPKVFLFDRPFSDLDARSRAGLRMEITKLHQRLDATMIYVAHDPAEALTMADRVAAMNLGVLQQVGTPRELYDEPMNRFVAEFVGTPSMNIIRGTLKQERESCLFREEGGTVEMRFPSGHGTAGQEASGQAILLGIRPQDIVVAPPGRAEEAFPAVVEIVESTGPNTRVYLQTGAHTLVCETKAPLDRRDAGRRMKFAFDARKAHLFDPISGLRLG